MREKFLNKYRIPSARLASWDYGANGAYFMTICTKDRTNFFGEISDGHMHLTETGSLAEAYWLEIPQHFPFAFLDEFVVMPNHIHGVLILDRPEGSAGMPTASDTPEEASDQQIPVTQFTPQPRNTFMSSVSPKAGSISVIIRSYKDAVKRQARKLYNPAFDWQPRFHDHIIRDASSFTNIRNYIANNVMGWKDDCFFNGQP